jgi:hypothetical protein
MARMDKRCTERDEFAWLVVGLQSLKASLLPPGWEDTLPSYDELMASLERHPEDGPHD